ncbi:uncharacterized protein LOC111126937 [Crassostrea virginica]|uniref:Uncharacterized protein LOC111126937 n=1 Tax=Crassostrea virginica TaxID=6565 RepID=A0A8B8DKT3_CRAVI|nr:uncharacterized protein LOC111126937 [Crassostrea virginica]
MYCTIFNFILAGCILSSLPVSRGRVPVMHQDRAYFRPISPSSSYPRNTFRTTERPYNIPLRKPTQEIIDLCKVCELFESDLPQECNINCKRILPKTDGKTKSKTVNEKTQTTTLGDALCAFCNQYPSYELSEICKKKLCTV